MSRSIEKELPTSLIKEQGSDPIKPTPVAGTLYRKYGCSINFMAIPPLRMLRDALAKNLLKEPERDSYLIDLIIKWSLFNIPLWLYLLFFCPFEGNQLFWAAGAVVHLLTWLDQLEVYILSLHCVVHRPAMKKTSHQFYLKWIFAWIFSIPMGVTPETYQSHHIGMHHVSNNGLKDISSTMPYQRDSAFGVFQYFLKFHFAHPQVANALVKLGNAKAMKKFVFGESFWFVLGCIIHLLGRPLPVLIVLWFAPVVMVRTGMCLGNWGQHSFLNDEDPHNNFNLSAVIIDSEYNTKAFNDGYHIQHHIYPAAHWLDLPKLFVKDMPKMAEHDSIVFTSRQGDSALLDWPSVTFLLIQGKYDVLADHFVDLRSIVNGTPRRSKEDIIALLKSRTRKPYTKDQPSALKAKDNLHDDGVTS